ncbi:DUF3786 domain-containing protein [Candidatus Latescibacterota bacterium]
MSTGEEKAWEILCGLDPEDVSGRADCRFDNVNESYSLESFGQTIDVFPKNREITGSSTIGNYLVCELGNLSILSILLYLIRAKEVFPSGHLVKPSDLEGGNIYLKGSHILPLDMLAEKFGNDSAGFIDAGKRLGGSESGYGDFSIQLFPFPRVPVVIAVWSGDEEFSSRCILLFDSTCELQLPLDALWATALLSTKVML